jgi:hypothetical protein
VKGHLRLVGRWNHSLCHRLPVRFTGKGCFQGCDSEFRALVALASRGPVGSSTRVARFEGHPRFDSNSGTLSLGNESAIEENRHS